MGLITKTLYSTGPDYVGHIVGTVLATDADQTRNIVSYSLEPGKYETGNCAHMRLTAKLFSRADRHIRVTADRYK